MCTCKHTTGIQLPPCLPLGGTREMKAAAAGGGTTSCPASATPSAGLTALHTNSTGWLQPCVQLPNTVSGCKRAAVCHSSVCHSSSCTWVRQLLAALVCLFSSAARVATLPSARLSLTRLKCYCLDQFQFVSHNRREPELDAVAVWFSKMHRKACKVWLECYLKLHCHEEVFSLSTSKEVNTCTPPKEIVSFSFQGRRIAEQMSALT